jgi:hypothetical protein
MKTRIAAVVSLAALVTACLVELPDAVKELNLQVNNLSNTHNSISISASANSHSYVSEFGVELSTYGDGKGYSGENTTKIKSPNLTSFDSTLRISVQSNDYGYSYQRYEVRAYAVVDNKMIYSAKKELTIDISSYLPVIKSVTNSAKTLTTLVMSASISDDRGLPVTERGFCWKQSGYDSPTVLDNKFVAGSGVGNFSGTIKGLTPNTTYSVRAYATNEAGTSYYGYDSYTTDDTYDYLPVIKSVTNNDKTHTTLVMSASISDDKGFPVTERGFCWKQGGYDSPTILDNKLVVGSGVGNFSDTIKGLTPSTTYNVSAYATNKAGTSYLGTSYYGYDSYTTDDIYEYLPVVSSVSKTAQTPN